MSRVRNYLSLLAVAWLLTGCALMGGTEAGNPGSSVPTSSANNEPDKGQYAQYLLDTVCVKYIECYPNISFQYCELGVLQQTNLTGAFGYSEPGGTTQNATAQDMVNSERAGRVIADRARAINCAGEIRQLSCADPTVNSAAPMGSNTSATTYTGVINMIPTSGTSCAGVF